jgi:hypothetical protein
MPISSPFLTIEYYFPEDSKLKPSEQKRQIALRALDDLIGLDKVTANITAARIVEGDDADFQRRVEAFDAGMSILGQLIAAIGNTAYAAVSDMRK